MGRTNRKTRTVLAIVVIAPLLATGVAKATGTRRPTISVAAPAASSTLEGVATVQGTATRGTYTISKVEVGVDGAGYRRTTGTSQWSASMNSASYSDGAHNISVRATDSRGNRSTVSVPVTFSNAPPAPTPSPTPAPNPTGPQTMVTPEGATIEVNTAGNWTTDRIYQLLKSAGLNSTIGPTLTVKVQDTYGSQVSTSAGTGSDGRYNNFQATIYLLGVNSTMNTQPDAAVTHEFGHVWTLYYLYMARQGDWSDYLKARGIANDARVDTSYPWSRREIIAEDYRLLFGSDSAISENPNHLNTAIPDPRNVAGLKSFLLTTWMTPK